MLLLVEQHGIQLIWAKPVDKAFADKDERAEGASTECCGRIGRDASDPTDACP